MTPRRSLKRPSPDVRRVFSARELPAGQPAFRLVMRWFCLARLITGIARSTGWIRLFPTPRHSLFLSYAPAPGWPRSPAVLDAQHPDRPTFPSIRLTACGGVAMLPRPSGGHRGEGGIGRDRGLWAVSRGS